MWQPILTLFKLIKTSLPFLTEVADEKECKDENDKTVVRRLKALLHSALWRIIFFTIFCLVVFYYSIPLSSENRTLRMELINKQQQIIATGNRIDKLMENLAKAQQDSLRCDTRLTHRDEELKRLNAIVAELRQQQRAAPFFPPMARSEDTVPENPKTTTETTKHKSRSKLSDETIRRISSIE